jgi:hypothetical protein
MRVTRRNDVAREHKRASEMEALLFNVIEEVAQTNEIVQLHLEPS